MANVTNKIFTDIMGGRDASEYIGKVGEIFYDPTTTILRISDGETPGGNEYAMGAGGGTSNRLVNGASPRDSLSASISSCTCSSSAASYTRSEVGVDP